MKPNIYLTGPDVFLKDSADAARRKRELCEAYGFAGRYPLDNMVKSHGGRIDRRIFDANVALMEECDLAIANLTPFRGPGADAGTVYEVGYMNGHGKPVFGYSNVPGDYRSRTAAMDGGCEVRGAHVDAEGLEIEDFGLPENLMVCHGLSAPMVLPRAHPEGAEAKWHDLSCFEECLRQASLFFGFGSGRAVSIRDAVLSCS